MQPLTEPGVEARNYWVFHARPGSGVLEDLRAGQLDVRRCVTQHARDIRVGDCVLLWVSGAKAGVHALGRVAGDVMVDADQPGGDSRRQSRSCLLRWDHAWPDDPIPKALLLATGGFSQARIVRQPMGGNPLRLTPEEWDVVQALR